MRYPPKLYAIPRYPITAGLGFAAIAVFVVENLLHYPLPALSISDSLLSDRPWTPLTSIFPHGDIIHIASNLYWLWLFGTAIERVYGHLRFLGLVILFAAGSSLAEYAVLDGGVGLSGVGYGLFGLLWVVAQKDRRFWDAIDEQTVQLMIGWFFACIALTWLHILNIANIAHGVGCILGILSGLAITHRGQFRYQMITLLGGLTALCVLFATPAYRPLINQSATAAEGLTFTGANALAAHQRDRAMEYLTAASHLRSPPFECFYNLALIYLEKDDDESARHYIRMAQARAPSDEDRQELTDMLAHLAPSPSSLPPSTQPATTHAAQ